MQLIEGASFFFVQSVTLANMELISPTAKQGSGIDTALTCRYRLQHPLAIGRPHHYAKTLSFTAWTLR